MKQKKVTAILPMRAGSQRIKNKNTKLVAGKPLYSYIIEALLKSNLVDKIVVNTDIKELFEEYADHSRMKVVERREDLRGNCDINHVIQDTIKNQQGEYFIQVHATNPLLKSKTIDQAIETYFKNLGEKDSLFSVTKIQKRLWDGETRPINHSKNDEPTTQNLTPLYEENSCLYIFSRKSFNKNKNRIGENPQMMEIDRLQSQDIDTQEELRLVEGLIKK